MQDEAMLTLLFITIFHSEVTFISLSVCCLHDMVLVTLSVLKITQSQKALARGLKDAIQGNAAELFTKSRVHGAEGRSLKTWYLHLRIR